MEFFRDCHYNFTVATFTYIYVTWRLVLALIGITFVSRWVCYMKIFFYFSGIWLKFIFLFQILNIDLKSYRIFLTCKKSLVESTSPVVFRFDQIKAEMLLQGYVKFLNDVGIQIAFYGDLTVSFSLFIYCTVCKYRCVCSHVFPNYIIDNQIRLFLEKLNGTAWKNIIQQNNNIFNCNKMHIIKQYISSGEPEKTKVTI